MGTEIWVTSTENHKQNNGTGTGMANGGDELHLQRSLGKKPRNWEGKGRKEGYPPYSQTGNEEDVKAHSKEGQGVLCVHNVDMSRTS